MVFPIVGGTQSTDYEISNSLRFNSADSAYLHITPNASNRDLFTISLWAKRSSLNTGARQVLFGVGNPGTSSQVGFEIRFDDSVGDGKLRITDYVAASSDNLVLKTNAVFKDPSAWYHIVFAYDSAQGTDSNRAKVYVNGTQITSFATATYPSQNQDSAVGSNTKHLIGNLDGDGYDYNGYLTEVNYVDGAAKSPTDFGKFDANGVWIPKKYTGTYGTNGFFLEFKQTGTSQNSSGIGADTSGNDNHFAVTNLAATDITTDTCTNNFATMNSIDHRVEDATLSEGNCKFVGSNGNDGGSTSTIGVTSGKWYAEFKFLNNHKSRVGIIDQTGHDTNGNNVNDGVHYDFTGGYIYATLNGSGNDTGDNSTSGGYDVTDGSTNDILGVALDADNEKVLFTLNGTTLGQEGDGFTNLQRTGTGETYFFHVRDGSGSGDDEPQIVCNFGNPPPDFSISSGNNDGEYGNFEYAPPSGFYALCTKRLAEFG